MKSARTRSGELIRIARLFYEKNCSKTEIARQMGLSITHVARLLDEIRETGVVRIDIRGPRHEGLARDLVSKYPCLRDAIVVGIEDNYRLITKALASAAAEYFDACLEQRNKPMKLGLSGGLTVFEFVKALPERERNIVLYPTAILGRGHTIINHMDPIASLMLLWGKSGYRDKGLYFVTVPPLEKKESGAPLSLGEVQDEIKALLKRNEVRKTYECLTEVDMIFASLRQVEPGKQNRREMGATAIDLLGDVGIQTADLAGAVGDVNYSFVDENGRSRKEWWRLFLSLQADQLQEMARDRAKRVVIMGGQHKERILRAALRGGLLNVLITDEVTAKLLLNQITGTSTSDRPEI
jgi:deoxyribonucleoside regulator